MKHPLLGRYLNAITEWDRVHRLVGRTTPKVLIEESFTALATLPVEKEQILVDVGAGAGILGFPWIFLNPEHKAIFIEPDMKKAAFLRNFLNTEGKELKTRCLIIDKPFEDVSRETILAFGSEEQLFYTSRAFSGPKTLEQVWEKSSLPSKEKFYVFEELAGPSQGQKSHVFKVIQSKNC